MTFPADDPPLSGSGSRDRRRTGSFPKLDGESRNVLEIAAIAGNQRDGTHNATRRNPKIVRGTPDFLLSPFIEQGFCLLYKGKKL